jgi:hypothetical protein
MSSDPAEVSSERAEHMFHDQASESTGKRLPRNQQEFESAVLSNIIESNSSWRDVLAEQISAAKVTERFGSGAGFKVYFDVPRTVPPIPSDAPYPLDGTGYLLKNVEHPGDSESLKSIAPVEHHGSGQCGAILLHYDGYLAYLDCHSYGTAGWPGDEYVFWFFDHD